MSTLDDVDDTFPSQIISGYVPSAESGASGDGDFDNRKALVH